MKKAYGLAFALPAAFLFAACGDDSTADDDDIVVEDGDYYHFVESELLVPTTATQSQSFAFDLDGDGPTENALGGIMSVLAGQDIDVQSQVDDSIAAGSIIILHSVRANDLSMDPSVSWQVFLGQEQANPDYTGAGSFTVDSTGPTDALLLGTIQGGQFKSTKPKTVSIKLSMVEGQPPITLNLVGARIQATVTATSCDGKLGGAVTKKQLDEDILPTVADMMNATIERDCGTPPVLADCPASSSGKKILDLFDDDGDAVVTATELAANELIATTLDPDVDLLDASGAYNPNSDGVDDSLSLGVGIKCVKGTFTAPGEQ